MPRSPLAWANVREIAIRGRGSARTGAPVGAVVGAGGTAVWLLTNPPPPNSLGIERIVQVVVAALLVGTGAAVGGWVGRKRGAWLPIYEASTFQPQPSPSPDPTR